MVSLIGHPQGSSLQPRLIRTRQVQQHSEGTDYRSHKRWEPIIIKFQRQGIYLTAFHANQVLIVHCGCDHALS